MADREPCALSEVNGALECFGSSSTIGGRALLPDGTRINFNQNPDGDGDFFETYDPAKHNFAYFPYLNAVSPIERYSVTSFGRLNITDDIDFFSEFLFTHRETDQIATPGTLIDIPIGADHPTNPTGEDILLQRRRLLEAGPREFFQDVDTWRVVGGFDGQLPNGWSWEAAANYGRNTAVDGSTNIANLERVADTLDTSICGTNGVPCGDYLGFGDLSDEVLDYALFTMRDTGGNEQLSLSADLTGELFELPAGPLAFALGAVYRKEKGWRDPDPLTVLGVANTNQQDPISGETTATEGFVELSIPVLANKPFFDRLTIDTALRYSDYDLFGGDTNYKLGVDWQVVPQFRARATLGTAFRVPNVPELFGGVAEGNLTTTDPCSGYGNLPENSTVAVNCRADGVPEDFVQLSNSILTTVGGNQDLKPESAESYTIGAVWQPAFTDGLTFTVDYFNIDIQDAIRAIPGSTKLATCYESQGLSHPFCSPESFTRNPITGEIDFLSAQPVNTGREEVEGIDFATIYGFDLGGLDASIDLNVTYLKKYEVTPFEGADPIVFDGFIGGGNGGYPEWRGNASFALAGEKWSGAYSIQWIGEATDFNAAKGDIGYQTPDVFYHNAQLSYAVSERVSLAAGVDNLFDEEPPYIQSWTDANTDTMTYDLLGRRFYARLRYSLY